MVSLLYLQTWSTSSEVEGNTCLGSCSNGLAILMHCSRNLGSQDTDPPPDETFSSFRETTEEDVPGANLRFGCGMIAGPLRGLCFWQLIRFAEMILKRVYHYHCK